MKTFLLGAAVGYVLGARAGHARYEQIVHTYRKMADHPAMQGAAGVARAKVGEKLGDRLPFAGHQHHARQHPNGHQPADSPGH